MDRRVEELRKHFSAYVKKSIQNSSKGYKGKKAKLAENETIYEDCSDLPELYTNDIIQQVNKISEHFTEGATETRLLLEQIEDCRLFEAIAELNEQQKNIISLRILYEKSFKEIGAVLGITEKKAENTYYNAIKKIRKMLGGNGYGL